MIYLLFYSHDTGGREDWSVFYTPVEAFSTAALRQRRQDELAAQDPGLEFETIDVVPDQAIGT